MLAVAKSAAPQAAFGTLHRPVLDFAAQGVTTLFTAPPGYLLTDSLAYVLAEHSHPILWLRLGLEDRDPATFLLSLIISARRLNPNVGAVTLEEMRLNPGPVVGWPRLYERLAYELGDSLPPSTAIVLEHIHNLESAQPVLGLIGNHLLPRLPPSFPRILISHHSLAPGFLPNRISTPGTGELRMNARSGVSLSKRIGTGLAENCIRRILSMTDGQAVALVGILTASQTLGSSFIHQVVTHSKNSQDLLSQIAKGSLAAADSVNLQTLSLAVELGYCHPALSKAILGLEPFLSGPWIQNLASGWLRIRSLWQNPLKTTLRSSRMGNETILRRVADFLAGQGEREEAIQMYFRLGDTRSAVRNIDEAANQWMNLGQWETLERWLLATPQKSLHEWPWLVYRWGEIAAVRGDVEEALKHFLKAVVLFSLGSEREGACQSLLAASTLADWKNDPERSWNYASAACSLAEAAGLEWQHGWATWQLGRLAIASGRLDEALVHFNRATAVIKEPELEALFREVEGLAMRQVELQKQSEFHRQTAIRIEQVEKEVAHRLQSLLLPPPQILAGMLAQRGWIEIPLMIKLPAPPATPELSAGAE
jgi:ATP/maltotriose-dependent transcriptional regulator MalT